MTLYEGYQLGKVVEFSNIVGLKEVDKLNDYVRLCVVIRLIEAYLPSDCVHRSAICSQTMYNIQLKIYVDSFVAHYVALKT